MLSFKKLEIQNFKSFGAKTTTIHFDALQGITLFMGENQDVITPDSRNGCGKSSILDAIAWVLTGKPIKERRDPNGVLNKVNAAKCFVSMEFTFGNLFCRLERGVKPSFLKLLSKDIDDPAELGSETIHDKTRSTIAETQAYLYSMMKLDIDLVRFILISATKTDSYFKLDANKQKKIIETLFGFESLTIKGNSLKEKRQKAEIKLQLENNRVQEQEIAQKRFVAQLESVVNQSQQWEDQRQKQLSELKNKITPLSVIDFQKEKNRITEFKASQDKTLEAYRKIAEPEARWSNLNSNLTKLVSKKNTLEQWIGKFDLQTIENYINDSKDYSEQKELLTALQNQIFQLNSPFQQSLKTVDSLKREVSSITENCPTCGQFWPDKDSRQNKIDELNSKIKELEADIALKQDEISLLEDAEKEVSSKLIIPSHALYSTVEGAQKAQYEYDTKIKEIEDIVLEEQDLKFTIENVKEEINTLKSEYENLKSEEDKLKAFIRYSETELARLETEFNHALEALKSLEENTINPHQETLESLKKETLETIDTSERDNIEDDIRHLKYLETLCTKKDSPVRRLVTSKWLPKLNELIAYYLNKSELTYTVVFEDDLSANIKDFDIEMDYADMSSGEDERLNMALCWAFRDVFENINYAIDFIAIDERLDAGLDGAGGQAGISILSEMATQRARKIFLVSHKKEMVDYVDQILMVKKKGRFSRIEKVL